MESRAAAGANPALDTYEKSSPDAPGFNGLRRSLDARLMGELKASDSYGDWSKKALVGTVLVAAAGAAATPLIGVAGIGVGLASIFGGCVVSNVLRKLGEGKYEQALETGAELARLGGLP